MRIKEYFEIGQEVTDTLANHKCIIRSIEKNCLIVSRVERPDIKYSQVPYLLKVT